jgi:glycerol-3-phosphate dehydrogenase
MRASEILGQAKSYADLGQNFGATLTAAEVDYLMRKEWARAAADVVWRRSKLGLRMSEAEIAALDQSMRQSGDARTGGARANPNETKAV